MCSKGCSKRNNQGLAVDSNGTVYVSTVGGKLFSIRGSQHQRFFTVPGISFTAPVVGPGDVIYVGGSDGFLYAISNEGRLVWKFKTPAPIVASPVVGKDRTIYVGSTDGSIYALGANGVLKWVYKTGGAILASPIVSPRKGLFVVSSDGNLYALRCSSEGLAASAWPKVGGDERNSGVFDPWFLDIPLFIRAPEPDED